MSTDFETEPGPDIQAAAERHIDLVWSAHYAQEDAEDGVIIPSPAVGVFCGCETCVVREIIAGAWPKIEEYFALRVSSPKHTRPRDGGGVRQCGIPHRPDGGACCADDASTV